MANVTYTSEHHEQAYRIYWDTRNYSRVSEKLDIGMDTARNWSKADFPCRFGCQWHNWEKLIIEQQEALTSRVKLFEAGNLDPIAHEACIDGVVKFDPKNRTSVEKRREAMSKLVRSDLERAAHWELLYEAVYFQLTGIVLDNSMIVAEGSAKTRRTVYESARKINSFEAGIKALKTAQDQIDGLKTRLGIYASKDDEPKQEIAEQKVESLTIEEARHLQDLMEHTPPEQLELIRKLMNADKKAVDAALAPAAPVVPVSIPSLPAEAV